MNVFQVKAVIEEANKSPDESFLLRVFTSSGRVYDMAFLRIEGTSIVGNADDEYGSTLFIDIASIEAIAIRFI